MKGYFVHYSLMASLLAVAALPALAEPSSVDGLSAPQSADVSETEPVLELGEFNRLLDEITRSPGNLDNNYRFAKLAAKLGKYYDSIAAYERMLMANPNLHRVKLDLALLLMKVGSNAEAKKLFEEVRATNPPEQVIKNIDKMLALAGERAKRHHFGGSVVLGYNADSNPSASPNSGAVDVFGIGIPVDDSTSEGDDGQKFVYASVNHTYQVPTKKANVSWRTEAGFYKSVQDNASELNTTSYNISTGPTVRSEDGRLSYGASVNCNRVNLDEYEYLNSYGMDVFADYIINRRLKVRAEHSTEHRSFENSPTTTTYEDRTGRANEQKLTFTGLVTPQDILTAYVNKRREHARVNYYTNRSYGGGVNYTRLFKNGFYGSMGVGYEKVKYKDVDSFVNPTTIRQDEEHTFRIGAGVNITDNLSCNAFYEYKDIESNIQNYAYENERVTASMNWRF